MANQESFFIRDDAAGQLQVSTSTPEEIAHEVMYEQDVNTIRDRPIFLGRSVPHRRFFWVSAFIVISLLALFSRAFFMQILQQKDYSVLAEKNRLRRISMWPRRGMIYDRFGNVLAENVSRFEVSVIPSELPRNLEERELILGEASRALGLSIKDFTMLLSATSTAWDEETVVAARLPYDRAMFVAVALPEWPGFYLRVGAERRYPHSVIATSFSHVLGYVGKMSPEEYLAYRAKGYARTNEIGKTGVERTYETALRGVPGEQVFEVDARGRERAMVGDRSAVDGQDLYLALDLDLQQAAERALRDGFIHANTKRGAVVAMDPRDGSILAIVSLPSYDHNQFVGAVSSTIYQALISDPDQPLFPRAWAGTYPSGSTVKIVISVAALAEKIINANTSIISVGGIHVGPWFFPDWKAEGHGITNVRKAIAWSVNTFYYTIGGGYESFIGLGVDRLAMWMQRFGLGAKTGIDVPAESAGFVPTKEWKEKTKGEQWFVGDTYNLSIGQGDLLVTPVQVAAYTAAIANGGKRITPHVALATGSMNQRFSFTVSMVTGTTIGDVQTVRLGMRDNILFGSGRGLGALPFSVGGKTGTAQWHAEKSAHAWFTCFAPFEKPEIVVTVLLEEGGEGSATAVPVAQSILKAWWSSRQGHGEDY